MNVTPRLGDHVVLTCPKCGAKEEGLAAYADMLLPRPPLCDLAIKWNPTRPIAAQIAGARNLFPSVRAEPIEKLRAQALAGETLPIGEYSQPDAIRLREAAADLGVEIRILRTVERG